MALSFGLTLGNYWFTYGLWPRSWVAFVGFALASIATTLAMQAVIKEKS